MLSTEDLRQWKDITPSLTNFSIQNCAEIYMEEEVVAFSDIRYGYLSLISIALNLEINPLVAHAWLLLAQTKLLIFNCRSSYPVNREHFADVKYRS
uniref:Uncharacterized protein n=1 Tax=Trichogramma kaykai TaxID=54128 RepID=A0ABD2XDT0_9HYME